MEIFPWNTAGLVNHSCDNNCDYNGKGLRFGFPQNAILKWGRSSLVIMVLVLIKTINNFLVNVAQKIVVVILLEKSPDGELIKNLL